MVRQLIQGDGTLETKTASFSIFLKSFDVANDFPRGGYPIIFDGNRQEIDLAELMRCMNSASALND